MSTLAIQSPEDAINAALVRIGYPQRVANIFEGTKQANAALNIYSQTRDELLRQDDWYFAERNVALTLQKQAPASYVPPTVWSAALYPPLPWFFQYAYPSDCLKVRAVAPQPFFIPNFDPQYNTFDTPNDSSLSPPQKVIVCNVANAICTYTGQITDPTTWDADFCEALIASLARRLVPQLSNPDLLKAAIPEEQQAQAIAETTQG